MDTTLEFLTTRFLNALDAQTALQQQQLAERAKLEARLRLLDEDLAAVRRVADGAMVARQEYLARLLTPWQILPGNTWTHGNPSAVIFRHAQTEKPVCEIRCVRVIPVSKEEPDYLVWQRRTMRRIPESFDGLDRLSRSTEDPARDLENIIADSRLLLLDLGWIIPQE